MIVNPGATWCTLLHRWATGLSVWGGEGGRGGEKRDQVEEGKGVEWERVWMQQQTLQCMLFAKTNAAKSYWPATCLCLYDKTHPLFVEIEFNSI